MSRGRITVAGSIAQKPGQAGHAWQFLQYLLGLRRLGWDVLFVDRVDGAADVRWLEQVMSAAGLGDAWTAILDDGRHAGVSRAATLRHVRDADLLINIMGFLDDEELLGAARRRVFLDTDPGFGQMWRALGLADVFAGHDDVVTIGERIGRPGCSIPTCGLEWITTPQPVVLSRWTPAPPPERMTFTSVGRWRGAYGPIDFEGVRYGLRVHEFRRFAGLPAATGARFELALDIHPDETADLGLLRDGGWTLVDPARAAGSIDTYRSFIAGSAAELMVAKGMYVASASGWMSERSLCYLASGRPVLAQDTGLGELYPTGEGLLTFSTLDEAATGVRAIRDDYARHARAARELAEAHFDSDKVLGRLLDRLGAA
jgi:hypothetical protein